MKVSLKLEDQTQNQKQNPILVRAKIPITVLGLPFLSAITATHHHHAGATASDKLSLSLRTHFPAGPSLKLSYNTPTTTPAAAATASAAPFMLTLKSGVSLSGSPNNSPLVISANFSFSPQNPNPSFSLQLKPRIGSFCLRKSISSRQGSNAIKKLNGGGSDGSENSFGFGPLERPINWKEFSMESATKDSILSGILVMANTELPVTKRVKLNLRWGVSVPSSTHENQLPYLRVNKIKFERIDEVKEDKRPLEKRNEGDLGEFEMLKGMYSLMSSQLSDLQKENIEMRQMLEEVKSGKLVRSYHGGGGKRPGAVVESSDGFEQWRMKKSGAGSGEDNGQREMKKNVSSMSDVESELQRAIKAASS